MLINIEGYGSFVSVAMEELLEEELLTERTIEEYTKFRECNAQSLLSLELRTNDQLASVVRDQKRDREGLIDRLRKDEVLQKAALAALLERSDARSWSIVQQVNLVQSQLVALTNIELERKKLEINQQIVSFKWPLLYYMYILLILIWMKYFLE